MKQPVAVGVAAVNWGDYMGGVYPNKLCDGDIDHAALLVSWGVDAGLGASWKMKNSWGVGWGEDGYIRLQRNGKFCTIDLIDISKTFACNCDVCEFAVKVFVKQDPAVRGLSPFCSSCVSHASCVRPLGARQQRHPLLAGRLLHVVA